MLIADLDYLRTISQKDIALGGHASCEENSLSPEESQALLTPIFGGLLIGLDFENIMGVSVSCQSGNSTAEATAITSSNGGVSFAVAFSSAG